jgi:hypothetical protein
LNVFLVSCYNFDVAMPAGAARSPRRTSRAFLDDATAFPTPLIDATGVIGCKPDWISMVALQWQFSLDARRPTARLAGEGNNNERVQRRYAREEHSRPLRLTGLSPCILNRRHCNKVSNSSIVFESGQIGGDRIRNVLIHDTPDSPTLRLPIQTRAR